MFITNFLPLSHHLPGPPGPGLSLCSDAPRDLYMLYVNCAQLWHFSSYCLFFFYLLFSFPLLKFPYIQTTNLSHTVFSMLAPVTMADTEGIQKGIYSIDTIINVLFYEVCPDSQMVETIRFHYLLTFICPPTPRCQGFV